MTRTPQEVFTHHGQALAAADLDGIVADYAADSVVITPAGVFHGKDGVREAFTKLLDDLPHAVWDLKTKSSPAMCCSSSGPPIRRSIGLTTVSTPSSSATA